MFNSEIERRKTIADMARALIFDNADNNQFCKRLLVSAVLKELRIAIDDAEEMMIRNLYTYYASRGIGRGYWKEEA